MSIFLRINNNRLFPAGEVSTLGFDKSDGYRIPDNYLEKQEFMVMRTCHGLGDWIILSAMPRLLKNKYPKCKVYLPSKKLLQNIFGDMLKNWGYGTFDASDVVNSVFHNNPYVDGFIDSIDGEIFHDHYRIFDENNDKVPLLNQMMKFWQFKDDEMVDTTPDFYPTEEEMGWFRKFHDFQINKYGYISASSTFGDTAEPDVMLNKIKEHNEDMVWYYYGEVPLTESYFSFLKNVIEVKPLNLTIRQQQILKINADVNYGNETGMNLWTTKYSKTFILGNKKYGPIHSKVGERKRPFKTGNFVNRVEYL
tara:strand:+ start:1152 stop:2075 length:924 start_codon:yes stop_codon:yes gene_type:complete